VASWKDYQERAGAFFRSLGLAASTDERIIGVRGSRDVDVAVCGGTAGIKQLWIVECKQWERRVNKLHVAIDHGMPAGYCDIWLMRAHFGSDSSLVRERRPDCVDHYRSSSWYVDLG
jgi:hypothetical protein